MLGQNVNLSAKAIMGIAAFAQLAERRGDAEEARRYRAVAERFARAWLDGAKDGGSTRLAFDRPGSWSLKYNLVWDRLLGFGLFPPRSCGGSRRITAPGSGPTASRSTGAGR